ncbi:diphosphomevalonate decarboxylase [Candidatus Daviesbacteria bacterium]|nr:diphosphomevalonate decarboxylase [Candidatus Daviesbacteria bacterium]
MKATAIGPSDIALTKYWGRKDEVLRLPENGSISMVLSNLLTTTTVEFSPEYKKDQITINGGGLEEGEAERVIKHLDRIRKIAKIDLKAKVVSKNNFPIGTGLSSSASGFAALTVAASSAAGLNLSEKELSILSRQASGSSCRPIAGGFVEWLDGNTSNTSYAKTIFPKNWWNIADVVAVVSEGRKEVPTSTGHAKAQSSPFLKLRLSRMKEKNRLVKKYIKERDFKALGELIEQEALELHTIMLTQYPPLIYWTPGTLTIMKLVSHWRAEGIPVYFTINTGQNIHLLTEQKNVEKVKDKLKKLDFVKNIIVNTAGEGTRLSKEHLF